MQDGGHAEEQSKQKPAILAGTGTLQSVPFMERPPPPARPMTKLKPQKVATARQASAGKIQFCYKCGQKQMSIPGNFGITQCCGQTLFYMNLCTKFF